MRPDIPHLLPQTIQQTLKRTLQYYEHQVIGYRDAEKNFHNISNRCSYADHSNKEELEDISGILQCTANILGFKCPVCSKFVPSDEMDLHLVMCLTKPRITYNEDVLSKDAGECAICLEELQQGDTIARLPCLCIYHKGCIDEWFEVNRSCPEHPSD